MSMSQFYRDGREAFEQGLIRRPSMYGVPPHAESDWLRGWDHAADAWAACC